MNRSLVPDKIKLFSHPHILPSQPLYTIGGTKGGSCVAIDLEEQHDNIYRYCRRELDRWELAAVQAGDIRWWAWGLPPGRRSS